mmetsp:Transcript_5241/g.9969  ORF Transcript_5241/g.9969 Transcript_5241/m.9969 type:complete len:227 (-) Transcript_5241:131-811(-)
MGNAFGSSGRIPNQTEAAVIDILREAIQKQPNLDDLQSLSHCFSISSSVEWKSKLGFQNEDPLKDIRGGGSLAVANLTHYCEDARFGPEAKAIAARRSHRDDGANYPFATAAVNITRALAVLFEVVTAGGNVKPDLEHTRKTYWGLLVSGVDSHDALGGYNAVFSLFFLLLDHTFTEMKAGYMDFPTVLKATQKKFEVKLSQCEVEGSASLVELERLVRTETEQKS